MKLSITFLLILTAAAIVSAQSQTKCFQLDALQGSRIINFKTIENDISGTFVVENSDDENAKVYEFSGKRTNNRLKIEFAGNVMPDIAPSTMKDTHWRLENIEGKEVLQIEFYGKNYTKNEYSRYLANFLPCEPDFSASGKQAKRLSFAKGKNSTTVTLSFVNQRERKSFWLGAKRNQLISITSPGCGISFYYPDKTAYEEGKAIDTLTIENVQQIGDYLFVISPAGEAGECLTEFKITN